MLNEIIIKNISLIDELEICFKEGLNILSGETGAGKSIILNSLNLILGGKASADFIRTGENKATIEARFDLRDQAALKKYLEEKGIEEEENTLILKRQLALGGKNTCFANSGLIPLNSLTELGDKLIDLHGQHQHQSLLKPETHIDYIDEFGNLSHLRSQVKSKFQEWENKRNTLSGLIKENDQKEQKKQLLEFQRSEIDSLNPQKEEKDNLLRERSILQNSGKLTEAGNFIYETIYDSEDSIRDKLFAVRTKLKDITSTDPQLKNLEENLDTVQLQLDEISLFLKNYTEKLEFNPGQQEEIENRLAELEKLEKKYGGNLGKVLEYRQTIEKELQDIVDLNEQIKFCSQEVANINHELILLSNRLSEQRKETAVKMEQILSKELARLGMEKNKFSVNIFPLPSPSLSPDLKENEEIRFSGNEKGIDQVEFLFSVNVGEAPKPLAKIASGGELSRVMLALKSLIAAKDQVPTLIFDEIDTGIGGRMAEIVGKKLKELSTKHQIICITHLPQIAAFADHHFFVEKGVRQGRTFTSIRELDTSAKINEIARMLGGEKITPTVLKHAREMLDNSQA